MSETTIKHRATLNGVEAWIDATGVFFCGPGFLAHFATLHEANQFLDSIQQ